MLVDFLLIGTWSFVLIGTVYYLIGTIYYERKIKSVYLKIIVEVRVKGFSLFKK